MKNIILLFVLGLVFLSGCTSQRSSNNETDKQGNSSLQIPGSNAFAINEEITNGGASLKVPEWGFAPSWGSGAPPSGAKFLWVKVKSTNIGGTPIELPEKFNVSYRGINVGIPGCSAYDTRCGHGYERHYPRCLYSLCSVFPNVTNEGYLIIAVPNDLQSGEAEFLVDMYGKLYKLKLVNPTEYSTTDLFEITNATFVCEITDEIADRAYCRYIYFTVKNNMPYPISKLVELSHIKMNGKELYPGLPTTVVGGDINLEPYGINDQGIKMGTSMYVKKDKWYYDWKTTDLIGVVEDQLNFSFTISDGDAVKERNFVTTLPMLKFNSS